MQFLKNNKGFTLVELIAVILLLALIMSVSTYSIIKIMNNAKEKDYQLLIENIKSAAENYYHECRYAQDTNIPCDLNEMKLEDFIKYGYLKSNDRRTENGLKKNGLKNPKDNQDISQCTVKISSSNGTITVTPVNSPTGSCPSNY